VSVTSPGDFTTSGPTCGEREDRVDWLRGREGGKGR
jgi:hypothetical protein